MCPGVKKWSCCFHQLYPSPLCTVCVSKILNRPARGVQLYMLYLVCDVVQKQWLHESHSGNHKGITQDLWPSTKPVNLDRMSCLHRCPTCSIETSLMSCSSARSQLVQLCGMDAHMAYLSGKETSRNILIIKDKHKILHPNTNTVPSSQPDTSSYSSTTILSTGEWTEKVHC